MELLRSNRGLTALGAIVAVGILGAFGAGMASLVAAGQRSRINILYAAQSFYSNHSALEYALRQIQNEGNPDPVPLRHFENQGFTIVRDAGRINATTTAGNAASAFSITDPNASEDADCLMFDVSDATTGSGDSGLANSQVKDIYFWKDASCVDPVTIVSITLSWIPNSTEEKAYRIQFEDETTNTDTIVYNGSAQESGNVFPLDGGGYTLIDHSYEIDYIQFTSSMRDHNITMIFTMSDGSSKSVAVNFLAGGSHADCFRWNTGSAVLDDRDSLWRELEETTVQNTCSDGDIILDRITVSWVPTSPARNFTNLRINGNTYFSGAAASGVEVDVDVEIDRSDTDPLNHIRFDSEMIDRDYTIVWRFVDGTTKVSTLDIFNSNEHDCLTITTTGAYRDYKKIKGITLRNTCSADIAMTAMTVSWVGEPTRRLVRSKIYDLNYEHTYASSAASGVTVSFGTNRLYYPNGSGVFRVYELEFNNVLVGGVSYTIQFTMGDGNTKSATFTLP